MALITHIRLALPDAYKTAPHDDDVRYIVGLSDGSFYIATIAIGKLGQLLLEYTLRRPGLNRQVIMWCFDDLLTAMAPVAATTASPDDKLT